MTELKKGLKFLRELNFFEHFQSRMHICLSAHCQNQHGSGHGHDSYNSLDFSGSTLFYWIGISRAVQKRWNVKNE